MKGKGKKGPAFTVGIEDYMGRQGRNRARTVKLQEIKDEKYHAYSLGVLQTLEPGMKFYITAMDGVEAVYLDRIIILRER